MNYLAQGLQQGWNSGTRIVEAKRDRKQKEELERARQALELETQAREHKNRKVIQDADLTFRGSLAKDERDARAKEADTQRNWHAAENVKTRDFTRGERVDRQGFETTQAQLDRDARALMQDKELKQRTDFFNIELPLKGAGLGLQSRAQEWQENPMNPYNRIRDTQADRNLDDMGVTTYGAGSQPPVSGQFRPTAPAGGRNVTAEPPTGAVEMLRKNPALAAAFDAKYGQGAAARYLGREFQPGAR